MADPTSSAAGTSSGGDSGSSPTTSTTSSSTVVSGGTVSSAAVPVTSGTAISGGGSASPGVDLAARFSKAEGGLDAAKQALADEARRRETDDRSTIAKMIVNVFVWLMVGLVVAVAVGTSSSKGWAEWEKPAEFMLKALSSVLLPVVTLVIGYYFGKEQK